MVSFLKCYTCVPFIRDYHNLCKNVNFPIERDDMSLKSFFPLNYYRFKLLVFFRLLWQVCVYIFVKNYFLKKVTILGMLNIAIQYSSCYLFSYSTEKSFWKWRKCVYWYADGSFLNWLELNRVDLSLVSFYMKHIINFLKK